MDNLIELGLGIGQDRIGVEEKCFTFLPSPVPWSPFGPLKKNLRG